MGRSRAERAAARSAKKGVSPRSPDSAPSHSSGGDSENEVAYTFPLPSDGGNASGEVFRHHYPRETSVKLPDSVPGFVQKVYEMATNPQYKDWVHFSPDGKGLIIPDKNSFQENVMAHFFRHRNFTSFVRQLNMYSFKKKADLFPGNPETMFVHPHFRRNNVADLSKIERKRSTKTEKGKDGSVVGGSGGEDSAGNHSGGENSLSVGGQTLAPLAEYDSMDSGVSMSVRGAAQPAMVTQGALMAASEMFTNAVGKLATRNDLEKMGKGMLKQHKMLTQQVRSVLTENTQLREALLQSTADVRELKQTMSGLVGYLKLFYEQGGVMPKPSRTSAPTPPAHRASSAFRSSQPLGGFGGFTSDEDFGLGDRAVERYRGRGVRPIPHTFPSTSTRPSPLTINGSEDSMGAPPPPKRDVMRGEGGGKNSLNPTDFGSLQRYGESHPLGDETEDQLLDSFYDGGPQIGGGKGGSSSMRLSGLSDIELDSPHVAESFVQRAMPFIDPESPTSGLS